MSSAERLVHAKGGSVINPRDLLGNDIALLTDNIRRLLGSGHPVLNTISNYYFGQQGKHVRPLIVLLMSQATSLAKAAPMSASAAPSIPAPLSAARVDAPLSAHPTAVAFGAAPAAASASAPADGAAPSPADPVILPTQRRLAEITEMIHTASLLHDDVIDVSMTRRGSPSANAEFGNKMAILAGDFLLARASVALARLRNAEVVELLATVISNLVEGEFMQLRNSALEGSRYEWKEPNWLPSSIAGDVESQERFQYYMEKTYMKTASLIALSCRGAAVLGGSTPEISNMAYLYGRNVGLAFQLVDDMLDFVVTADEFGKPVNADLKLGLATAPVLYAAQTFPELYPLMERKFCHDGDVEKALELVFKSDGIARTRALAEAYCTDAISAISTLPPSLAQTALIQLTQAILTRRK
ncbi:coq1 putative hexaprenyl diphosphate synthase [Polyrhizophydium stewartii]|uniref:Coq1 putative hexaprenyl diphosphate synthase n=1 Tax=Polyrhizophydium stewartii TaxID=2732419 RepID=A0ABR4MXT1_9FUNG